MLEGGSWLEEAVSSKDATEWTPFTTEADGKPMAIDASMVKNDQQELLLTVMSKVKEWAECATSSDVNKARSFKPLCLTVQGCAGSGKSFFIKCLVNTVREVLGEKNVIHVVGPTGAAAWSVGGQTMHRKFGMNPHSPQSFPSEKQRETMMRKTTEWQLFACLMKGACAQQTTLGLLRGALQQLLMEEATKESCSGGCPSFCLLGMTTSCPHQQTHKREHLTQLEGSLHTHKGKLELLHQEHSFFSTTHLKSAWNSIKTIKRQKSDQVELVSMLGRLRSGHPTPADADKLVQCHLTNFGNAEVEAITSTGTTMHLFAKKAPRDEFNYQKLHKRCPVQATQWPW